MKITSVIGKTLVSAVIALIIDLFGGAFVREYIFDYEYLHGAVELLIFGVLTVIVYLIIEQLLRKYTEKQLASFGVKLVGSYIIATAVQYLVFFNISFYSLAYYDLIRNVVLVLLIIITYFLLTFMFRKKKTKLGKGAMFVGSLIAFLISSYSLVQMVYSFATGGYDNAGLGLFLIFFIFFPLAIVGFIGGGVGMYTARK